MKICSKCRIEKRKVDFSKKSVSADGLRSCCKECDKSYRQSNLDKIKSYARSLKSKRKELYWANIEKSREYKRVYVSMNRQKIKEANRLWAIKNPEKKNANRMKYLADKRLATPRSLSKDMLKEIQSIYKQAITKTKETGVPHHVDHVIPLCGVRVCGLHVPWNLQVLTAKENQIKGNKVEGVHNGRK